MKKILRRLQELTDPESLRLLGWSLLTVVAAAALLRTKRLPALLRYLGRTSPVGADYRASLRADTRSIDRVRRYSHVIITGLLRSRRPCLLRSLVLYRYCWKHGVPVTIHFGVRPGTDGMEGHSWVTRDGTPLGESEAGVRPYVAVYSHPVGTDGTDSYDPSAAAVYLKWA